MAASQVRLLALTDRLHDIESKSQQILAQKLALGTQKDALYNDYCDALEATNYMVAFRGDNQTTRYVDATYSNMCTYNPDRMRQYALTDARSGKLLVSQEEKKTYETYKNDKYAYAMAMMGLKFGAEAGAGVASGQSVGLNPTTGMGSETYLDGINKNATGPLTETELSLLKSACGTDDNFVKDIGDYEGLKDETAQETAAKTIRTNYADTANAFLETADGKSVTKGDGNDVLMTEAELRAFMAAPLETRESLQGFIDAIYSNDCKDQNAAFEAFRDALYDKLGTQILAEANAITDSESKEEVDNKEFEFHINQWTAIKNAGGCEVIDARYEAGEDGREWLENSVKAGLVVIQECIKGEWQDTSVATSTNGNYLIEESDDTDLKKAEAEYNYELDIIDRKETKMDNELAKLETERKAITTEMDSLKTVKDDNIDRTFGIFG